MVQKGYSKFKIPRESDRTIEKYEKQQKRQIPDIQKKTNNRLQNTN